MTAQQLHPLFDAKFVMSADEARAIAGALQDIAESDGVHEEEKALISELLADYAHDLGDGFPTVPEKTSPEALAKILITPEVRTVAVQSAVLLAMADGAISNAERSRVIAYASALGFDTATYTTLEAQLVKWVQSGDASPLFA